MKQKERILNHLKKYGSITQLEAIKLYWDWRLSDKIYRLKKDGHNIKTVKLKVKRADGSDTYVCKYELIAEQIFDGTEEWMEENISHIPSIL